MPKRLLALLVALAATLSLPAAGSAATVPKIVAALKTRSSYVEPALRKKIPLAKAERAAARHGGFKFVFLAALPPGSKTVQRAANRILVRYAKPETTLVVLWKGKLGVQSNVAAYKAKIASGAAQRAGVKLAAGGAPVRAANAVSDALAGPLQAAKPPAPAAKKGGGSSWWKYLLAALFVLLVVGALILLRLRTREARKRRRSGSLSTARQFHLDRLEGLALRHAGLARAVADRPDDAELAGHHTEAGAKLTTLRRTIPGLYSPRELRTSAGELDLAEWHLASAEARLASTEPPLRPIADQPALCFFSHELGLATNSIEVRKADGSVARVRVSAENHAALEAGEDPIVSRVHVGGRLVPWPAAPTWYGAAGWAAGDLPGLEYEGREIWGADAPRREPADPRAISGLTPDETAEETELPAQPEVEPTGAYTLPDAEEPEATNPWLHDDVEAPAAAGSTLLDADDEDGVATVDPEGLPHDAGDGPTGQEPEPGAGTAPAATPRAGLEFDELDDDAAPSFDWAAHMAGDQGEREGGTGGQDRMPSEVGETTVEPAAPWTLSDPAEVTDPFSPAAPAPDPEGGEAGAPADEPPSERGGARVLREPPSGSDFPGGDAPADGNAADEPSHPVAAEPPSPAGGAVEEHRAEVEDALDEDAPPAAHAGSGEALGEQDDVEDGEDARGTASQPDPWDERPQG